MAAEVGVFRGPGRRSGILEFLFLVLRVPYKEAYIAGSYCKDREYPPNMWFVDRGLL